MRKDILVIGTIIVLLALFGVANVVKTTLTGNHPQGVACTKDAKLCPDGSSVGRVPPACEFAACGAATSTGTSGSGILPYHSGIRGVVILGPTCPVERIPPDPKCADKPYATAIMVSRIGSTDIFASGQSDASGLFQISLPPGTYSVSAKGGATLPRCASQTVTVGSTGYTTISISCDTGIR